MMLKATVGTMLGVVALMWLSMLILFVMDEDIVRWKFERSPISDICYERRGVVIVPMAATSMSPVDDSFCEEGE